MTSTKRATFFGLAASACLAALALSFPAGTAHAGTVTVTSESQTVGYDLVTIDDASHNPIENPVPAGRIDMATASGTLQTYCTDIFDFTNPPTTYNANILTAGQSYVTGGGTTGTWTASQVSLLNALLVNGSIQTQNALDTAALQIAIWQVEYGTAAANGTYNLTASNQNYYFSTSNQDGNSGAALSLAQTYLNDVTGYLNGQTQFVGATWLSSSSYGIEYLTATGYQNLVTLVANAPEPSTIAVFGLGLAGLLIARRRKMI